MNDHAPAHSSRNTARVHIPRHEPSSVFAFVTDIDALTRWNDLITDVTVRPPSLEPGAVWKVAMADGPMRWISRSTVVDVDPEHHTITYRSGTDDGNPSYTEWCWIAEEADNGTMLTVQWSLHALTRFRRWILARYRGRRLRREVPTSLARIRDELDRTQRDGADYRDIPRTLLGVWAHPDDEAYLSATLMQRVVANGGRVVVLTATRGEAGLENMPPDRAAALRERELRDSLEAVGVSDVRLLGLPDGGCAQADWNEVTRQVETVMREVAPDLVVTFGPDGITGHPDHAAVSSWALAAWQRLDTPGRLLLATMTDDFLVANRDFHERIGMSMGSQLQSVPDHDIALRVTPSAAERASKAKALDAHRSQTRQLADLVGYDAFHDWWAQETFRIPTTADLRWAIAQAEAISHIGDAGEEPGDAGLAGACLQGGDADVRGVRITPFSLRSISLRRSDP